MEVFDYFYIAIPLLTIYFCQKYFQQNAKPPGPKGWPFIGNLFQFGDKFPHQVMERWGKAFGDIYRIKVLGEDIIVVSSDELIREVTVTNADAFSGRPANVRMQYFSKGALSMGFSKVDERWIKVKKAIMTSLKAYGLKKIEELTLECAQELLENFESHQGEAFNPHEMIYLTLTKVIYSLTLGQRMTTNDAKRYSIAEKELLKYMALGGPGTEIEVFPILGYFRKSITEKIEMIGETIRSIVSPGIAECKSDKMDNRNTIFHALLKNNETVEKEEHKLSDLDLSMLTAEMLGAGTSTSAGALHCLIAIIVTNPIIGKKIQAEIDVMIGPDVPSLEHKKRMPYVNAVLMELLRYISHVPTSLPHTTTKEVELGGYTLPKGQQVWVNLWAMHHDERYWEEPEVFKPERFLTQEGELIPSEHPNRHRLMPFGAGRRVCVGENLAKNRLFMLVCLIYQRFDILPESDKKLPLSNPRTFKFGLVLEPESYNVRFIPRKKEGKTADVNS